MTDHDRSAAGPRWGAGADDTSELPTANTPRVDGSDRTQDFGARPTGPDLSKQGARPSPGERQSGYESGYAGGAASGGYASATPGYAQRPAGRIGTEPVPGPYAANTVRRYGAFLPALAAAVVAVVIAAIPGIMSRNGARPPRSRFAWDLWYHASFYDYYGLMRTFRADGTSQLVGGLLTLGVVVFVLTLIALTTQRRHAARGLTLFAVWGITTVAGAVASAVAVYATDSGLMTSGARGIQVASQYADIGAGFGLRFGWLVALAAVLLRIGRRVPGQPIGS